MNRTGEVIIVAARMLRHAGLTEESLRRLNEILLEIRRRAVSGETTTVGTVRALREAFTTLEIDIAALETALLALEKSLGQFITPLVRIERRAPREPYRRVPTHESADLSSIPECGERWSL